MDGLTLTAERGGMKSFELTPDSQVVGASTILNVEWVGDHVVPKGGFAILSFPKWNQYQENEKFLMSYIQGDNKAKCLPLENKLTANLKCEHSKDQLIVSDVALNRLSPGIKFAFSVSGFRNPIDTSKIPGFKLQTAIKSESGEYFIVDEATTEVQVSEYGSLS